MTRSGAESRNDPLPHEIRYTRCPVPTLLGIAINQGVIERDFEALGIGVRSIQDSNGSRRLGQPHRSSSRAQLPPGRQRAGHLGTVPPAADTRVIGLSWVIITLPRSGIRTT